MKFLLDENLPPALAAALAPHYPGSMHVHGCGLGLAGDAEIWAYARQENCTIVTKDADFEELSMLKGAPPKVIWLRTGNCSTDALIQLFNHHQLEIDGFLASETDAILQIRT